MPTSPFALDLFNFYDTNATPGSSENARVIEDVDAPGELSSYYTLNVGDSFSGTMSVGLDEDFVAIELAAGQSYTFNLVGASFNSPLLRLYSSNGTTLETEQSIRGDDLSIQFNAAITGTYYLAVRDYYQETGTYRLETSLIPQPELADLDEMADFLTDGYWQSIGTTARSFDTSIDNILTVNTSGLTPEGSRLAHWALEAWARVADLEFRVTQNASEADIVFQDHETGAHTSSTILNGVIQSSTVNISTAWLDTHGTHLDGYSFATYIHEIGRALGLGRQGPYSSSATYGIDERFINDSWQYSVMSYFSQEDNTALTASFAAVIGAQMVDILAIQNMYGASTETAGDTVWGSNTNLTGYIDDIFVSVGALGYVEGLPYSYTIYDHGGIDLLDLTIEAAVRVDLRGGHFSDIGGAINNLGIARGTVIENLHTSWGNDTITGNWASNEIDAGQGDDHVVAGAGWDNVIGYIGRDTIYGGDGNDTLDGGADEDNVYGGAGDDVIYGGEGRDIAGGSGGNDLVWGDTGNDQVWGAAGRDTLHGGEGHDTVGGGHGNDLMYGDLGSDILWGGDGEDVMNGGAGNDELSGGGGGDYMNGGTDNDTLWGSWANDVLDGGSGNDLIGGGSQNDLLYGREGDDTLRGSWGNDTLVGGGGDDELDAGVGADTFIFYENFGRDTLTDFNIGEGDRLWIDAALWGGGLSAQQVVDQFLVTMSDGSLALRFSADEHLILDGVTISTDLVDVIDIL